MFLRTCSALVFLCVCVLGYPKLTAASTCISQFIYPLGVSNILLTVLGFVVSLAISLRSTTSYERYSEGRKYWAQLMLVSQTLAREIWVSASERDGEEGKEDVLGKLYCPPTTRLSRTPADTLPGLASTSSLLSPLPSSTSCVSSRTCTTKI